MLPVDDPLTAVLWLPFVAGPVVAVVARIIIEDRRRMRRKRRAADGAGRAPCLADPVRQGLAGADRTDGPEPGLRRVQGRHRFLSAKR